MSPHRHQPKIEKSSGCFNSGPYVALQVLAVRRVGGRGGGRLPADQERSADVHAL